MTIGKLDALELIQVNVSAQLGLLEILENELPDLDFRCGVLLRAASALGIQIDREVYKTLGEFRALFANASPKLDDLVQQSLAESIGNAIEADARRKPRKPRASKSSK